MKFVTRIAIVAAAVLLTLTGFNLLVPSSTLDIFRSGRTSGMEIVVTAQARSAASPAHTS